MTKRKTGELYCLVFADQKLYIGASLGGGTNRYVSHRQLATRGSKSPVHKAWRKLGPPKLIILATGILEEDLWPTEKRAIRRYRSKVPNGYNQLNGSDTAPGHLGKTFNHTEDTKKRISTTLTGHETSQETRKKIGDFHRGRKHTEEQSRKQSERQRGKPSYIRTEEIKNKNRLAMVGRKHTPEQREKNRQGQLGKKLTDKHKHNISQSNLGRTAWNRGKKHSKKTKEKMRLSQLAQWAKRKS